LIALDRGNPGPMVRVFSVSLAADYALPPIAFPFPASPIRTGTGGVCDRRGAFHSR
jgi:hypothetical protein